MKFSDITSLSKPLPWKTGDKIPWNDPSFSKKILSFHLNQSHNWASRCFTIIDAHIQWITSQLSRPSKILDLGCGPGLYTERLVQLGHICTGVDFSPASIDYARLQARTHNLSIDYHLADLRNFTIEAQFDLVMMTFGEFNVFRKEEIHKIIQNALKCLTPDGLFICEVHTFNAIYEQGTASSKWQFNTNGLFSDEPHLYLEEALWDETQATATTRYLIINPKTDDMQEYGSTTQAYTDDEYLQLFKDLGLNGIKKLNQNEWPTGTEFNDKLQTFIARKSS